MPRRELHPASSPIVELNRAAEAYRAAIAEAGTEPERQFLCRRLADLADHP